MNNLTHCLPKNRDANIHKFIVDYREMKDEKMGAYKTQFNTQLEKMKNILYQKLLSIL